MKKLRLDGLLVMDKPGGMTSRDVVNRAQKWFPRKTRLGHTGTLDPLATGVLVLCVGSATRLAEYVQRMTKQYHTLARLGAISTTDDADGEITERNVERIPNREEIENLLPEFLGEIQQAPPAFSAAKVTGQRAYKLARQGEQVELQSRPVRVDEIVIERYEYPELELNITCGKGTYIRSIVRDLGEALSCGGYVQTLRRLRVGEFRAEEGLSIEADKETAHSSLLPLSRAVSELPVRTVNSSEAKRLQHGQVLTISDELECAELAILDETGHLIAIGRAENRKLKSVKVLPCIS